MIIRVGGRGDFTKKGTAQGDILGVIALVFLDCDSNYMVMRLT